MRRRAPRGPQPRAPRRSRHATVRPHGRCRARGPLVSARAIRGGGPPAPPPGSTARRGWSSPAGGGPGDLPARDRPEPARRRLRHDVLRDDARPALISRARGLRRCVLWRCCQDRARMTRLATDPSRRCSSGRRLDVELLRYCLIPPRPPARTGRARAARSRWSLARSSDAAACAHTPSVKWAVHWPASGRVGGAITSARSRPTASGDHPL